jgi:hypothetical protein
MNAENQTMGINVENSPNKVNTASPVPYQLHQLMEDSISTPNPEKFFSSGIQLRIDERRLAEREAHGPYWEFTEYTPDEINAIREADKLDPDLAEHYKDLLED